MIDLTHVPLFEDLTSIKFNGKSLDLHNEYIVSHIGYDAKSSLNVTIEPHGNSGLEKRRYGISFESALITKMTILLERLEDSSTINILYRGRFEKDGKVIEYAENGSSYFYLEFENGNQFELFTNRITLFEI